MGRERTRKGKHFLFYPACCIAMLLLGICGCIRFMEALKDKDHLSSARTLFADGKYEAALKETREVLRLYPRDLGDEAIFQMGLIYACPKNPDQDYERALKHFQRVIKEFPKSKIRSQAEAQVLFIQEREIIGQLKQKNGDLEKALKKEKENVKELESQVEKLKDQLLRLKEIDLGIEEKKSHAK